MRPSPLRHPIAVLRQITGLSQGELAGLCDCSKRTIQSVELGPLKLSRGLSARIAAATGVDEDWLLSGDPRQAPTTRGSEPYSKQVFDRHRAEVGRLEALSVHELAAHFNQKLARLVSIFRMSIKIKKESLFSYRLDNAIDELSKEFGDKGGPI